MATAWTGFKKLWVMNPFQIQLGLKLHWLRTLHFAITSASFSSTLFPSTQLSVNMLGYSTLNSQLLWQWMFVAYTPCEGCQWLSSGQLSDQQSSPWLCSLVNQTERPFWRLRKHLKVFWVDSLIGMSQYSNLLRTKDLNYFSLCALNWFNTQVSQFELNYWNK